LVALDGSLTISHIIEGDYRDGLGPIAIKWSLAQHASEFRSILIYEDFTLNIPEVVTRIIRTNKIVTVNVDVPGTDDGAVLPSRFQLAPCRFSQGISHFNRIRLRAMAGSAIPCHLEFSAKSEDDVFLVTPATLTIPNDLPGREYTIPFNLVNEQCRLVVSCDDGDIYKINWIVVDGKHLWDERAR
jgi:hypothetical protein